MSLDIVAEVAEGLLLLSVEAGRAKSKGCLLENKPFDAFTGNRFAPSKRAQRVLGSFLKKVLVQTEKALLRVRRWEEGVDVEEGREEESLVEDRELVEKAEDGERS